MNLNLYITVGAAGIIALSALWGMMFKKHSLLRLVCVAVRAVAAFIGTLFLKSSVTSYVDIPALYKQLTGQEFTLSENMLEIATSFVSAFVSVIVFIVLYFVLWFVLLIVRWIVMIMLGGRAKKKRGAIKSGLYGLIQGLIFLTVLLVPVSTYVSIADKAMATVAEATGESAEIKVTKDYISVVNKSSVVKAHRLLGGNMLSDSLTSIKIKTGDTTLKTNLNDEISAIVKLASDIIPLTKTEPASYTDKEIAAINRLGDSVTKSKLLCAVISELLVEATEAWDKGEAYLSIEKPSFDPTIDPILYKTLDILASDASTPTALKEDINTFTTVVTKLLTASQAAGEGGLQEALLADGLISDMLNAISENERMRPLIPAITNVGLSIVADSLGIDADAAESYNKLSATIADELKAGASLSPDERQTRMENTLKSKLSDFGITDISDGEISIIAMSAIVYFDGGEKPISELTADDVSEFMADMVASAGESDGGSADVVTSGEYGMVNVGIGTATYAGLTGTLFNEINGILSNKSLNIPQKEEAIEELIADFALFNDSSLSPAKLSTIKLSVIALANRSAENSEKALVAVRGLNPDDETSAFKYTKKAILISDSVLNSTISAEAASSMITATSTVFDSIATISSSTGGAGDMAKVILESFGTILDTFSSNEELYGSEKTDLLLQTVLHSGKLIDIPGVDVFDMQNTLSARADKDVSYTALLGAFCETADTLLSVGEGTASSNDKIGTFVDALANECAGSVIAEIITPNKLADMGFSSQTPEQLEETTKLIKSVFSNIVAGDEQARENEVAAIKNFIEIATEATKTNSTNTDAFGESGRLGCTADELVSNVLASNSISIALAENELTENTFGAVLTDGDKEAAKLVIEAELADATENEAKTLASLANLLGITL